MRIKLKTSITGPIGSFSRGSTAEWPDDVDAARLIDANLADPDGEEAEETYAAIKASAAKRAKAAEDGGSDDESGSGDGDKQPSQGDGENGSEEGDDNKDSGEGDSGEGSASGDGDEEPPADDVDATDSAKDLAAEHDLDLAAIKGTGKDGRILLDDVRLAVAEKEE